MNPDKEHIDIYDRLGRFLSGESSSEEIAWVESWLAESAENRQIFEGLAEVWTLSDSAIGPVNVDAAWDKVSAKTGIVPDAAEEEEAEVIPLTPDSPAPASWKRWLSIAAVLLLPLAGFVYLMVTNAETRDLNTFATAEEVKSVTLPDGTQVTLNENSSLTYPSVFDGKKRRVELEGEAYFDVVRDPEHPFYVHAGAAEVKVLGTTFNVKARKREVKVTVESGKVRFAGRLEAGKINPVELAAGDAATYNLDLETMDQEKVVSENTLFWKNRKLEYNGTRLEIVAQEVSDLYPGKLKLGNPIIHDCPVSTTFDNKSMEEIAVILSDMFNLEVTPDGKSFILDGDSCE